MGFNATILAVPLTSRDELQRLENFYFFEFKSVLKNYSIVPEVEQLSKYIEYSKSTKIDRFIRVKTKSDSPGVNNEKKLKIDDIPYEDGVFTSPDFILMVVTYMTVGSQTFGLCWLNIPRRLTFIDPSFETINFSIGERLSRSPLKRECFVLHATTKSRSRDKFTLYVEGRERHTLNGKGALTEVRRIYGLDINVMMDAVDSVVAISFAPYDMESAQNELAKIKQKIGLFEDKLGTAFIEHKVDHTNLVDDFRKEHEALLHGLVEVQIPYLSSLLVKEVNGIIKAYRLYPYQAQRSKDSFFGGYKPDSL